MQTKSFLRPHWDLLLVSMKLLWFLMQQYIAGPHFFFSSGEWGRWLKTVLGLVVKGERFELCTPKHPNLEKWEVSNVPLILGCSPHSLFFYYLIVLDFFVICNWKFTINFSVLLVKKFISTRTKNCSRGSKQLQNTLMFLVQQLHFIFYFFQFHWDVVNI